MSKKSLKPIQNLPGDGRTKRNRRIAAAVITATIPVVASATTATVVLIPKTSKSGNGNGQSTRLAIKQATLSNATAKYLTFDGGNNTVLTINNYDASTGEIDGTVGRGSVSSGFVESADAKNAEFNGKKNVDGALKDSVLAKAEYTGDFHGRITVTGGAVKPDPANAGYFIVNGRWTIDNATTSGVGNFDGYNAYTGDITPGATTSNPGNPINTQTLKQKLQKMVDDAKLTTSQIRSPQTVYDFMQLIMNDATINPKPLGINPPTSFPANGKAVFSVEFPGISPITVNIPVVSAPDEVLKDAVVSCSYNVDISSWNKLQAKDFTLVTSATGMTIDAVNLPLAFDTTKSAKINYDVVLKYSGQTRHVEVPVNYVAPTQDEIDKAWINCATLTPKVTLHNVGWRATQTNPAATDIDWTTTLAGTDFTTAFASKPVGLESTTPGQLTVVSAATTASEPSANGLVVFNVNLKIGNATRTVQVPVSYEVPTQNQRDLATITTVTISPSTNLVLNEGTFNTAQAADFIIASPANITITQIKCKDTTAPAADGHVSYELTLSLGSQTVTRDVDVPYQTLFDKLQVTTQNKVTDADWNKLDVSNFSVAFPNNHFVAGVKVQSVTPPAVKPTVAGDIDYTIKLQIGNATHDYVVHVPYAPLQVQASPINPVDSNNWNKLTPADFNITGTTPAVVGVQITAVHAPATAPASAGNIVYTLDYYYKGVTGTITVTTPYTIATTSATQQLQHQIQQIVTNGNLQTSSSQSAATAQAILDLIKNDGSVNPKPTGVKVVSATTNPATFEVVFADGTSVIVSVPSGLTTDDYLAAEAAKVTCAQTVDENTWNKLAPGDFTLAASHPAGMTISQVFAPSTQPSADGVIKYNVELSYQNKTIRTLVDVQYKAPTAAEQDQRTLDGATVTTNVKLHEAGWRASQTNPSADDLDWTTTLAKNLFTVSASGVTVDSVVAQVTSEPTQDDFVIFAVTIKLGNATPRVVNVAIPYKAPTAAQKATAAMNTANIVLSPAMSLNESNFDKALAGDFVVSSDQAISIKSVQCKTTTAPTADGNVDYELQLELGGQQVTRTVSVPYTLLLPKLNATTSAQLTNADWNQLDKFNFSVAFPNNVFVPGVVISKVTPQVAAPAATDTSVTYTVTLQLGTATKDFQVQVPYTKLIVQVTTAKSVDNADWDQLTVVDFKIAVTTPLVSGAVITAVHPPKNKPSATGKVTYEVDWFYKGLTGTDSVSVNFTASGTTGPQYTQQQLQALVDAAKLTTSLSSAAQTADAIKTALVAGKIPVVGVIAPAAAGFPTSGNATFTVNLQDGTSQTVTVPLQLTTQDEIALATVTCSQGVDFTNWNKLTLAAFTLKTSSTGMTMTNLAIPAKAPTTSGKIDYVVTLTYKGQTAVVTVPVQYTGPTQAQLDAQQLDAVTVTVKPTLHFVGWAAVPGNTVSDSDIEFAQSLDAKYFTFSDPTVTFVSATTTQPEPSQDGIVVYNVQITINGTPKTITVIANFVWGAKAQLNDQQTLANATVALLNPNLVLDEANYNKLTANDFIVTSTQAVQTIKIDSVTQNTPSTQLGYDGKITYTIHLTLNGVAVDKTVDVDYKSVLAIVKLDYMDELTVVQGGNKPNADPAMIHIGFRNGVFVPGVTLDLSSANLAGGKIVPTSATPSSALYDLKVKYGSVSIPIQMLVPIGSWTFNFACKTPLNSGNWNKMTPSDFQINPITTSGGTGIDYAKQITIVSAVAKPMADPTKPPVIYTLSFTLDGRNQLFTRDVTISTFTNTANSQLLDQALAVSGSVVATRTLEYKTWNKGVVSDFTPSAQLKIVSVTPPTTAPTATFAGPFIDYTVKVALASDTNTTKDIIVKVPYVKENVVVINPGGNNNLGNGYTEKWTYDGTDYSDYNTALAAAKAGEVAKIANTNSWVFNGKSYGSQAAANAAQLSYLLSQNLIVRGNMVGVTGAGGQNIPGTSPVYIYNSTVYDTADHAIAAWKAATNPTPGSFDVYYGSSSQKLDSYSFSDASFPTDVFAKTQMYKNLRWVKGTVSGAIGQPPRILDNTYGTTQYNNINSYINSLGLMSTSYSGRVLAIGNPDNFTYYLGCDKDSDIGFAMNSTSPALFGGLVNYSKAIYDSSYRDSRDPWVKTPGIYAMFTVKRTGIGSPYTVTYPNVKDPNYVALDLNDQSKGPIVALSGIDSGGQLINLNFESGNPFDGIGTLIQYANSLRTADPGAPESRTIGYDLVYKNSAGHDNVVFSKNVPFTGSGTNAVGSEPAAPLASDHGLSDIVINNFQSYNGPSIGVPGSSADIIIDAIADGINQVTAAGANGVDRSLVKMLSDGFVTNAQWFDTLANAYANYKATNPNTNAVTLVPEARVYNGATYDTAAAATAAANANATNIVMASHTYVVPDTSSTLAPPPIAPVHRRSAFPVDADPNDIY